MRKGGKGGNKTITGLNFEKKTDLLHLFSMIPGYSIKKFEGKAGHFIFFKKKNLLQEV